jgi:hypothetical protein
VVQDDSLAAPLRDLKGDSMRKFAIMAMLLGMPLLSRAQTAQNTWGALNSLHAGQRIEIVETHLKRHNGLLSTVTDETIHLREGGGDVGIKREDVMRVTLLDKSHRLRNALIFGAVGAGAGAGIGAATHRQVICTSPCTLQNPNTLLSSSQATGVGAVIGLAGGAGIGAAIPSHPTIYRVAHH